MSSKPTDQFSSEFASYYLQRTTQELSEDLDKVRNAEDFKADSIPFLVHALQQGAGLFSPEDQKRVVAEPKAKDGDA
jgi:ribosome assembly protein 3